MGSDEVIVDNGKVSKDFVVGQVYWSPLSGNAEGITVEVKKKRHKHPQAILRRSKMSTGFKKYGNFVNNLDNSRF